MTRSRALPSASRRALWPALVLVLGACSTAPDKRVLQLLNDQGFGNRYVGNPEEENYITIGDSLAYRDAYHAELTDLVRVEIDGTVILPEVGAVHVAGLTRTELEGLLTQKFSPYYERNDIKVTITTGGKFYYIYGEVFGTGPRPFLGDTTIFEAVMEARPNPTTSNLGRVRLIRADPVDPLVVHVNVGQMLTTGDSTFNVLLQERDIIVVPPTLLAQIGNFVGDLISPITQTLQTVFFSLIRLRGGGLGGFGRGGRNNPFGGGFGGGGFGGNDPFGLF